MAYAVELDKRCVEEFSTLPEQAQVELAPFLNDLSQDPLPPSAKKLPTKSGYRIHKESYRILYTIDDQKNLVRIYRIGPRRDI